MSETPGQARHRWRWPRRVLGSLLSLLLVAGLGLGWVAWRLAEAPMPVPVLADQIRAAVAPALGGGTLEVGGAALVWGGFRDHLGAPPVDLRLTDLVLRDAGGSIRGTLREATVGLSLAAMMRGTLTPATVDVRGLFVRLDLTPDGTIGLGLPNSPAPGADAQSRLTDVLAALRRVRLREGTVRIEAAEAGRGWSLDAGGLELRRGPAGVLAGTGTATVSGDGAPRVELRLTAGAAGADPTPRLGLTMAPVPAGAVAALWPSLAPLAALDAPIGAEAELELDRDLRPTGWRLRLRVGQGAVALAGGRVSFGGLDLDAEGTTAAARLRTARLSIAEAVLSAQGSAAREGEGWQAGLDWTLDGGLDMIRAWPPEVAPGARAQALAVLPELWVRHAAGSLLLATDAGFTVPRLRGGRIEVATEGVVLALGNRGRAVIAGTDLVARLTPDRLDLDALTVRLPMPRPGTPGPILTASGSATLAEGQWRAALGFGVDAVAFTDIARYWPAGLQVSEREWISTNITAGEIRNARYRLEATAPATLDTVDITAFSGLADANDATIHWLRPVPPVVGVSGIAEFGLREIVIRARGGRQSGSAEGRGLLEAREAVIRFYNLDTRPGDAEIRVELGGPLTETLTLLRHPRLKLFDRRPLPITATGGTAEARVFVGFPLWNRLPIDELKIRVTAKINEARLTDLLLGRDFSRGAVEVTADTEGLRMTGTGQLADVPLRLDLNMDFRTGPPTQLTERATVTGRTGARGLASLGFDTAGLLDGTVALDVRAERRRSGQATVALRGDLREARLALEAAGVAKPPGVPASAEGTLRLMGDAPIALEGVRVEAPGLSLRGRLGFGNNARLDRIEVATAAIGATRLAGEARRPAVAGGAWGVSVRGPVLDLGPVLERENIRATPPADAVDEPSPPIALDARFDRVTLGEGRMLAGVSGRAMLDARGVLREARIEGRAGAENGAFQAELFSRNDQRRLRLVADDTGALLRAFDLDAIDGGRLVMDAGYAELRAGAPLAGTAQLDSFVLRDAPAAAKLLQALSIYGIAEAVQGGTGLVFSRLIAPFTLTPEAISLGEARAYSASLGLTARGRFTRATRLLDLEGTIVPAYMLNTALGNLPLVGRLFSPERGGGLFAATFRVTGPVADPQVSVNPLAALTPGMLRGLFGAMERPAAR